MQLPPSYLELTTIFASLTRTEQGILLEGERLKAYVRYDFICGMVEWNVNINKGKEQPHFVQATKVLIKDQEPIMVVETPLQISQAISQAVNADLNQEVNVQMQLHNQLAKQATGLAIGGLPPVDLSEIQKRRKR